MTRRVRVACAGALAMMLVGASCGGESEVEVSGEATAAAEATTEGAEATTDATEAAAETEEATDAAATEDATEAPTEAAATEEATDEPSFEGDGDSDWCRFATEIGSTEDELDAEEFDFTDPDALRETYGRFRDQIEGARDAVPDEIEDDFALVAESFVAFDDALAAVDYNFLALDQTVLAEFDTAELAEASNNIDLYNEQVCGIPADSLQEIPTDDGSTDGGATDEPLPTGTVLDSIVAALVSIGLTEEQATCLVDALGPDALAGDPASPAYLDAFTECDIDPATLGAG